jgi:hypothetical protein
MTKFFSFIVSLTFLSSCLFGRAVPGDITFTFLPQSSGVFSIGTWEAIVFTPDGHQVTTGPINVTSLDPIPLLVSVNPPGYIPMGTYLVELKSNVNQADQAFLFSLVIECSNTDIPIDTMTFGHILCLGNGENTQISYTVPAN